MKWKLISLSAAATQMKRWKNDDYPWQLMRGYFLFHFYLITLDDVCAKLRNNLNAICVINHVNYFSYMRVTYFKLVYQQIAMEIPLPTYDFVFHTSQPIARWLIFVIEFENQNDSSARNRHSTESESENEWIH